MGLGGEGVRGDGVWVNGSADAAEPYLFGDIMGFADVKGDDYRTGQFW